jgi:hypothetical protein
MLGLGLISGGNMFYFIEKYGKEMKNLFFINWPL